MPRTRTHLEINNFVRGLVTEASPLTFPDNASLDEDNFVLNIDGTRDRRLGIDYEENQTIVTSPQAIPSDRSTPFSTFNWENAGGVNSQELIVVQIGNRISFFDALSENVSSNQIGTDFEVGEGQVTYSFAAVDGSLVVASNTRLISIFDYDGAVLSVQTESLKIRDHFGVEDIVDGEDLFDPQLLNTRPSSNRTDFSGTPIVAPPPGSITNAHLYNLRNQSWGIPRTSSSDRTSDLEDPILIFEGDFFDYPSNSDVVHAGVFVDPEDTRDPPGEALFPYKLGTHPETNEEAPSGFFVIDALNRGSSRDEAYQRQCSEEILGSARLPFNSFLLDRTPDGATALAEFSGRVFYSGFKGTVTNGDNRSPNMSSYILFSRLVKHPTDLTLCYQEGDPTDKEQPEVIATDGGFIRVEGAYGINRLVNTGSALIILADNGVWALRGETGKGFSATAYEITKITDRGCLSPTSVVLVDDTVFYWSKDGIYVISINEVREFNLTNITHETIRKFYNAIDAETKTSVQGSFDSFQRQITWTYGGTLKDTLEAKQLKFDTKLGAFFPATIKLPSGEIYPRVVAPVQVPSFKLGTTIDEIVVSGDQVQVGGIDVEITSSVRESRLSETKYLTVTGENGSGNPLYTFSEFKDQDFLDWKTFNSTGVDANAFLLTGHLTGGDSSRNKYVPNIFFHFKRTEDGFIASGDDAIPTKESSCKVQAQWEWANSAVSGRFGREFQAYRYKRHFMPESISDPYDNGFETIVTRNRLRGKGRALSLLMKTEPGKDLRILGWGQEMLIDERA